MIRAYEGNVELRCPGSFHPHELVPQAVSEGTNTITPTDTKHTPLDESPPRLSAGLFTDQEAYSPADKLFRLAESISSVAICP